MKKLFTLTLMAFLAVQSYAQLAVTCNGEEVKNGDEIVFYATEAASIFGGIDVTAGPEMEPLIAKTGDSDVLLTVAVSVSSTAEGAQVSFCGVDNLCINLSSGSHSKTGTLGALGTAMQTHATFVYGQYGTVTATVSLSANASHVMTFTEKFVYDPDHLGIENASTSGQTLTFDGSSLNYSFGTAAPRALQVFSLDGKAVGNCAVNGTQGKLSLSGLQRGVYVYRLLENGRQTKSQKIVIK